MIIFEEKIRKALRSLHYCVFKTIFPAGHYYSPIVSKKDIIKWEEKIYSSPSRKLEGINLNESFQMEFLDQIEKFYKDLPWSESSKSPLRYYYRNNCYSYSDVIFLYSFIRNFKPRRIIEVGSGFSSAAMLDTIQLFLNNETICQFIDPDTSRIDSLFTDNERTVHKISKACVQDVDINVFSELNANDILFIDSSHVCKTGNDVHYLFFNVLPQLKPGVFIHFHDIYYPFEYPKKLAYDGYSWNENYLLRAFLSYNSKYKIIFMNTFMQMFCRDWFEHHMPLCLKDEGASIWLKKL